MDNPVVINGKQEIDPSQNTDRPLNGTEVADIRKHIVLLSPDLTTKDAGRWLSAQRIALNTYNPVRTQLYDFYTYILAMDSFLNGLIEKRHKPVLNKRLIYKEKGGEKVDAMDEFIRLQAFRDLRSDMLWTKRWGISGYEFTPGKDFHWKPYPRKHIKPKWQIITKDQNGTNGSDAWDYTKLWNSYIIGNPDDLGDLLSLSLMAAFKKDAIGDWAELIEVFGRPTQVIEYPAYNQQNLAELRDILDKAGSALRILIPSGSNYRQEGVQGGNANGDMQMQFINMLNEEMATRLLGGTETTLNTKGGSNAKSKTHMEQQKELLKSDMDDLLEWLNDPHFINILKSYGWPVQDGGYFDFDREVDIDYLKDYAPVLVSAQQLGVQIPKKWAHDTLGIPLPKDGEEVLEQMQQAPEPDGDENDPAPDTPKPAGKKKVKKADKKAAKTPENVALSDEEGDKWWRKVLVNLSSFFDPARR